MEEGVRKMEQLRVGGEGERERKEVVANCRE